jgi:hypothetical protein
LREDRDNHPPIGLLLLDGARRHYETSFSKARSFNGRRIKATLYNEPLLDRLSAPNAEVHIIAIGPM